MAGMFVNHSMRRWNFIGIFFTAFFIRALVAFIYYGSCDVNSFILIPRYIFGNNLPEYLIWNYFPTMSFYLWLSGFLTIITPLPVAFCAKLIPIFFDALIAVLVADIAQRLLRGNGIVAGWLYALCPVPIIVFCIHGQYDALFLFFLLLSFYVREFFTDSYLKFFVFGFLFGYAFLLKTVVSAFFPLLFMPRKGIAAQLGVWWRFSLGIGFVAGILSVGLFAAIKYLKLTIAGLVDYLMPLILCALVGGMVMCGLFVWWIYKQNDRALTHYLLYQGVALLGFLTSCVCGFFVFTRFGFNSIELIDTTLRYCNQGVQLYGLPYAFSSLSSGFVTIIRNRIWLIVPLIFIFITYYRQKIDTFGALSTGFAVIVGFSGFCPQYLMWLIPFFLLKGALRYASVYAVSVSLFYVLFYGSPFSNPDVPYQSGLSFSPLFNTPWLFPPAWCCSSALIIPLQFLGNVVIPLVCLSFVATQLITMARGNYVSPRISHLQKFSLANWYLIINFLLAVLIVVMAYGARHMNLYALYDNAVIIKRAWYVAVSYGNRLGALFQGDAIVNVLVAGIVFAIIWSMVTWYVGSKGKA
jgi:hypothetical protein